MSGSDKETSDKVQALVESIENPADLMAYAYAMEAEAVERYEEIADQMVMHNNDEVAEIFSKLAKIERIHTEKLAKQSRTERQPHHAPWEYHWTDPEGPETVPVSEVHYLMTPHHALRLALHNERRAQTFYDMVAKRTDSDQVRKLAEEFAAEEREHVALVEHWLEKFPEPAADWDEDPDEPLQL